MSTVIDLLNAQFDRYFKVGSKDLSRGSGLMVDRFSAALEPYFRYTDRYQFKESEHPRDGDGKFTEAGMGEKSSGKSNQIGLVKNQNGVEVYPVIWEKDSSRDGATFEFSSGGRIKVKSGGGFGNDYSSIMRKLRRKLDDHLWPFGEDTFVRVTWNKEDYEHLKSGTHRGSFNHATGESEDGLSVAKRPEVPMNFAYLVKGNVIGEGADGEPLLDTKSATPASDLMTSEQFASFFKKEKKKYLKKIGWTEEQARMAFVMPQLFTTEEMESSGLKSLDLK